MIDAMDGLVDEVLRSLQARMGAVEAEVMELRKDIEAIRNELETARMTGDDVVAPASGLEKRIARIERRLDSVDLAVK